MAAVDHYNIRRVIDIYASCRAAIWARSAATSRAIVDQTAAVAARQLRQVKGQLETMRASYTGLAGRARLLDPVLVYLLIVVNFQSWLDPFIIITALPAALAGIVLCLFFTGTTSACRR
jgi:multidrug efflux pump subunit AcrB